MEVVAQLNYLAQQNIIDYQPQKDVPQLSFLTPRHNASDLPLDTELLETRKKEALQKVRSVINYVSNPMRCRTQILLHYFGEKTDEVCGVCDNCIKNKKATNGTIQNQYENIKTQVLEKITINSVPIHQLKEHFKNLDAISLGKIVQEMIATGQVEYDKSGNLVRK